ncbi:MAG: radical SAM protein [Promethearchaeota archaeon]
MNLKKNLQIKVDKKGRLVLPKDLAGNYGIKPGSNFYLEEKESGLYLRLPTRLLKLYIEPTNKCNLACRTCIRRTWNEPMGMMSEKVFDQVIDGLKTFSPSPTVFFGGFGEPLSHPNIIEMIATVKKLGSKVELITNGTLLSKELSKKIIKAGLDILWVSIDGASPESYADIRMGAELPKVLENVAQFHEILSNDVAVGTCGPVPIAKTSLGIAFVAMKRNISDLPAVLKLAYDYGANHFVVSNVLPYTKEMCEEILYKNTVIHAPHPEPMPRLSMPLIDAMECTREPLYHLMQYGKTFTWTGRTSIRIKNRCPFIETGSGAIGWDGGFSPCLSLLHNHSCYYQGRERYSRRWTIGNIKEKGLSELWYDQKHVKFREKVQEFDYAPCVYCGGCEMANDNEEDCQGNEFPTCGGCLWAQGVIQCP